MTTLKRAIRVGLLAASAAALLILLAEVVTPSAAQTLHPAIPLLDGSGTNVLESGEPVSTMETCGSCHDADFIAQHAGPHGEGRHPADTAEWNPLNTGEVPEVSAGLESIDEMNCFLCHIDMPDNDARLGALAGGQAEWSATATLNRTGVLQPASFEYDRAAFSAEGLVLPEVLALQSPADENCGQCHGVAHSSLEPLVLDACSAQDWSTLTTGQIFAGQRISDSGMNIAGKENLARPFDVHAERLVSCVDCHHAANNPIYAQEGDATRPEHLAFDPRRADFGVYLERPLHDFTASQTCTDCHTLGSGHDWLPYTARHMNALACESCHVPELNAPTRQYVDWTVIQPDGSPVTGCRAVAEQGSTAADTLITGYTPSLVTNEDGLLAPFNVVTAWYWVSDGQPVPIEDVHAAYLDGESYAPEVLAAFDANDSGTLSASELVVDSDEKEAAIAARLAELGYAGATIHGEVQSFAVHHSIASDNATRECTDCHSNDSRVTAPVVIADRTPGGVLPNFGAGDPFGAGQFNAEDGALLFETAPIVEAEGIYVFGRSRVPLVDLIGIGSLLVTFAGIIAHGGLRVMAARRRAGEAHPAEIQEVYMYSVYERLWHWLQSLAIFGLLVTGLIIHRPDILGFLSFRSVVLVHNVLGFTLLANAALALFYHVASGEIRQFLPEPRGFFSGAIKQALYYVYGIFRGAEHPFEKTPQRKMNPIQQVTYLAILNVLLPLQIITGLLMWGASRWPEAAAAVGGLAFLAPVHTLAAWLFAAFIALHVYMTTTGHTPLAGIKGMIMGWDEVETHPAGQRPASNK